MQIVRKFFRDSELLDALVLRQLAHIKSNWELTWDGQLNRYETEENSFAEKINALIDELDITDPPLRYHDNEDRLAEEVQRRLGWKIRKIGNRWVGANYPAVLEQGAGSDVDQRELMLAAAGRIRAAVDRSQMHFDEMEESHRRMLADVLAIVLYWRADA